MITQHEWVEGCYAYYAENYYQPGNPEDGEWHDCHYPVPKCEGGEVTIKLLKQHHAVQGVLQSEEYARRCTFGWESEYLEGEIWELFNKWQIEGRRQETTDAWAKLTPEERSERGRKTSAGTSPETRSERARKAALKRHAQTTPEQRSEAQRIAALKISPEQRRERSRRGGLARQEKRRAEMLQNVTTP